MKRKKKQPVASPSPVVRDAAPLAATANAAQRLAATILECLAGVRSPPEAAELLGVSLPRYYQLEARALEGLVAALGPRPRGKQPSLELQITRLEKELEAAQRACARQEALVRVTQRSLGLAAQVKPKPIGPSVNGTRSRSRRPMVRALRAARGLRAKADSGTGQPESSAVQPLAPDGGAEEVRP